MRPIPIGAVVKFLTEGNKGNKESGTPLLASVDFTKRRHSRRTPKYLCSCAPPSVVRVVSFISAPLRRDKSAVSGVCRDGEFNGRAGAGVFPTCHFRVRSRISSTQTTYENSYLWRFPCPGLYHFAAGGGSIGGHVHRAGAGKIIDPAAMQSPQSDSDTAIFYSGGISHFDSFIPFAYDLKTSWDQSRAHWKFTYHDGRISRADNVDGSGKVTES